MPGEYLVGLIGEDEILQMQCDEIVRYQEEE